MDKKGLRKIFLKERTLLSEEDRSRANGKIMERFRQLNWKGVEYVHLFLPITEKGEIDTLSLIDWLRLEHPEVQILVPRANFSNGTMEHIVYTESTVLESSNYGIPEPKDGVSVPSEKVDRVFIPLVCFDEKGYRVGYGKGFYDRFLAECRPNAEKIGLSFFKAVQAISDIHEKDIKLDACICPEQYYSFS